MTPEEERAHVERIRAYEAARQLQAVRTCVCHLGSVCGDACDYRHHGGCPKDVRR